MSQTSVDVAIIGAGTAGCLIAHQLHAAGMPCVLIEKSRGLGGRCSRRSIDDIHSIDLGTPEITPGEINNTSLRNIVNQSISNGHLVNWPIVERRFDGHEKTSATIRLCGTPSMNGWHKQLTKNIDCMTANHVHRLKKVGDQWQLLDKSEHMIVAARKVIVTAPAEQSYHLLGKYPPFADIASKASSGSLPQYVCALAFDKPLQLPANYYQGGHSILDRAIRENSKPGPTDFWSSSTAEIWTLHSSYKWAATQSDKHTNTAASGLQQAFSDHFNLADKGRLVTAHYWRLASHKYTPNPEPYIWSDALQLGCCGDWMDSNTLTGALNSSFELANHLLKTTTTRRTNHG